MPNFTACGARAGKLNCCSIQAFSALSQTNTPSPPIVQGIATCTMIAMASSGEMPNQPAISSIVIKAHSFLLEHIIAPLLDLKLKAALTTSKQVPPLTDIQAGLLA